MKRAPLYADQEDHQEHLISHSFIAAGAGSGSTQNCVGLKEWLGSRGESRI